MNRKDIDKLISERIWRYLYSDKGRAIIRVFVEEEIARRNATRCDS